MLTTNHEGNLSTNAATNIKAKKKNKDVNISFKTKSSIPKMMHIGQMLDPKISLYDTPKSCVEEFVQNHCLSSILSGVNCNVSQATTVSSYNESAAIVTKYHNLHLGGIEIDGKKFAQPPKFSLNEHNIVDFEHAILNTFKEIDSTSTNSSPFSVLRGPFERNYSIFNDGIQKFGMELNGVMVRALDENFDIVNVPWKLTEIPGGSMNHCKLVSQIVSIVNSVQTFGSQKKFESARKTFIHKFESEYPDSIAPTPPSIFDCCMLTSIDFDLKSIHLVFENWHVALVADGCSVNKTAGEVLVARYGLLSPSTRCSAHAASGSIKLISSSKTMCVDEVVTFADGIRPVLQHFQLSGKSNCLLNDALAILDMKQIKVVTWCPTRMANLLTASSQTVALLFPLCDVLVSCDIKTEERAYFMSPTCVGILHLFADLDAIMIGDFLRKLDTDDAVIMDVYGESMRFIEVLNDFKTPLYDQFISGLVEDDWGNTIYKLDNDHITLQYSARSFRRGIDKVAIIKGELDELKGCIIKNLQGNVADQSQCDTIVQYASAFDFNLKSEKDDRISHLKKLYSIYGVTYTHTIDDDNDLPGFEIHITYPAKLQCTEAELVDEFNKIWPVLNKLW